MSDVTGRVITAVFRKVTLSPVNRIGLFIQVTPSFWNKYFKLRKLYKVIILYFFRTKHVFSITNCFKLNYVSNIHSPETVDKRTHIYIMFNNLRNHQLKL